MTVFNHQVFICDQPVGVVSDLGWFRTWAIEANVPFRSEPADGGWTILTDSDHFDKAQTLLNLLS